MTRQVRSPKNLENRIHEAERELFAGLGIDVEEFFIELAHSGRRVRVLSYGRGPAVVLLHGVALSAAVWAPLFTELAQFRLLAVDLPGHGLSRPDCLPTRAGTRERRPVDRRHPGRARARRCAGDRPLARRHVRPMARGGRLAANLCTRRDRNARRRTGGREGTHAALADDGPLAGLGVPSITEPGSGIPALPRSGPWPRGGSGRAGRAGRGTPAVRAPPGKRASRGVLMHAIDRFRRPRAESVLTNTELAAIRIPTTFILGSEDPYLSVDRARQSIEQIPGATVHEVLAGHGPWLVDPRRRRAADNRRAPRNRPASQPAPAEWRRKRIDLSGSSNKAGRSALSARRCSPKASRNPLRGSSSPQEVAAERARRRTASVPLPPFRSPRTEARPWPHRPAGAGA